LPPDPLAEQLYRRLREDLLLGVVPPGTHLTEEWAAAAYEASRTPVREAYRRLALEGLLVHRPRRGYLAPEITVDELDELYEMRLVLEAMSARRAAEIGDEDHLAGLEGRWDTLHDLRPNADVLFLDEAFHVDLARSAGTGVLAEAIGSVNARIRLVRVRDFLDEDRVRATVIEHLAIVTAVRAGDSGGAARLMSAHIRSSRRYVMSATRSRAA
jgi:DNA-binding GntR family transcriptional regulator